MITKTLVAEDKRMDFLPKYIGKPFFKYELLVYRFMDMFCENYMGGYWQFYELSNGGMFICIDEEKSFRVCNDMNYFDDSMSGEAVSLGVNMCALNALMDCPNPDRYIDLYYQLRDFICEHKETNKILRFID